MATDNMTTWDSLLKENYTGQRVADLVYKNRPLLAMMPKNEAWAGRNHPLPLIYGDVQNRSADIVKALAGTTGVVNEQFTMTLVKNYSVAKIDNQLLRASATDLGAFERAAIVPIDSALNALSNDTSFSLFRSSDGSRGQVNAEPSEAATTVITLKSTKDISGFAIGQVIVFYAALSGGSIKLYDSGVSTGSISAIDRSAGTITIATAYTSSGTIAANDYIFVDGDRGAKMSGLADWIPASAPSSAAFYGVDRSADPVRLAGNRTTGTGMTIEEALLQCAFDVADIGDGNPDVFVMNHKPYARLLKQLGSKVQYVDMSTENAGVGFRGVVVQGASGPINVLADRHCPNALGYALEMSTWEVGSLGSLSGILDEDVKMLRQSAADGYEVRTGGYMNLGCKAPGHNGVVSFDA